MYSIGAFGAMIADGVRMPAYTEALRRAVRPGSVVLDIGTGTGIFALLACRFGARRVYAVEPSDAIQVGRQIAAANGLQDRIQFIQEVSTRVTLPELADVIVSDLRGALPPLQRHLLSIADARRRLLAPGGVLIPQRDILWVSIAEAAPAYQEYLEPWSADEYGVDMTAARQWVTNTWKRVILQPEQLLAIPRRWAELDYRVVENPAVAGTAPLAITRAATGHGLCVWFDAELAEGIGFSTGPGTPTIYGSAFFPWSAPVALRAGDAVDVSLRADLTAGAYVWSWESRVRRAGATVAHYRQSTFFGVPLPPDRLRKRADSHVPVLSQDGQIDLLVLDSMRQGLPLGQIGRLLADRYPERFARWEDALAHVGELSVRYSR